ncbi:MAG: hypothetical protein IPJ00_03925 [Saprospirales bacterium]|nr:hypothetical protein [Saprospirales bacterium]
MGINRNEMIFLEFQKTFSNLPIIPVAEIEKAFPGFDRNALIRWQKKGYLQKIRSGFYRLTERMISSDRDLFFAANHIYAPSYISLHSALSWYGFIPEGVFTTTSVSTRKTQEFKTPIGYFSYRSIKRELFFGYRLVSINGFQFKIADPAKTLLDFLYLNPQYDSEDDFDGLRLNFWEIQDELDLTLFENYLHLFASKSLDTRAKKPYNFWKENAVAV